MKDRNLNIGKVYSSERIYKNLEVNTSRGIKYTGTANDPNYIVLLANLDSWSPSNPYHDRLDGDDLCYTGEGLEGEQELIGGNLALSNYLINHCPIYVFIKLDTNEYKYLGQAKLNNMSKELQYDKKKRLREVFIYNLKLKEYTLYQQFEDTSIMEKDILNFEEASQLLGVSTRTLTEILKSNEVPGRKLGRQWYFSRKDLIKWIGSGISKKEY